MHARLALHPGESPAPASCARPPTLWLFCMTQMRWHSCLPVTARRPLCPRHACSRLTCCSLTVCADLFGVSNGSTTTTNKAPWSSQVTVETQFLPSAVGVPPPCLDCVWLCRSFKRCSSRWCLRASSAGMVAGPDAASILCVRRTLKRAGAIESAPWRGMEGILPKNFLAVHCVSVTQKNV